MTRVLLLAAAVLAISATAHAQQTQTQSEIYRLNKVLPLSLEMHTSVGAGDSLKVWQEPISKCFYFLTLLPGPSPSRYGNPLPRLRSDGKPDCPDVERK